MPLGRENIFFKDLKKIHNFKLGGTILVCGGILTKMETLNLMRGTNYA
jgi:hypothetical protein